MSNSTLKVLLNEYEQKRLNKEFELEQRKASLYSSNKRLAQIDNELNSFALNTVKSILSSGDTTSILELENKIKALKLEREKILNSLSIPLDYFNIQYDCDLCNDTGYVENNGRFELCRCIKQKLFDLEYNKNNIGNLEKENFENFNFEMYSNKVNEDLYSSNLSPRDNVKNIYDIAINFINNFDVATEKNLLFIGNTGLGKTFLSNCIANELLKKGKTILYQTAPVMLDAIIDYRFGKDSSSKDIYNNILDVDFLVIDDLGTECMNSMKFTELFNIINTRLLNQNNHITKTLISTNLSLQNLHDNYDERIFSRFIGNYNICRFFGEDIRLKKK